MLTVSFATHARPPVSATEREVNTWRDESGRIFARGYTAGGSHRIAWPGLGSFSFRRGTFEVVIHLASGASPQAAEDAVLRVLQPMMLQALGYQALHASGVAPAGGVMALCGRSGNGKSTLAHALAARGFPQFSDDAVVLQVTEGVATALPLPFRPRLRGDDGHHLDSAGTASLLAAGPAPLKVVVVLEQTPGVGPAIPEVIPEAEAFPALVTHAHCFDPHPGPGSAGLVEDLLTVAGCVPVHRLRYEPGPQQHAQVVESLVALAQAHGLSVSRPRAAQDVR